MEQDLIAELRLLLQEVITPELELLLGKIAELQQQMKLTEQSILEALAAYRIEADALRAEVAASQAELRAEMETLRARIENEPAEEDATRKPNRFVM